VPKFLKKLHWLDFVILAVLIAFVAFIWLRIEGNLNYKWNWKIIPNYILRWREDEGCLRNVPPVVVVFIFFFFLSEQLIVAFNIEGWARGIAKSDSPEIWEFFFGDMRRFPSLISGVVVLALFESAFVGEIVRAGIQSIPKGQREAARSIGMSWSDEMRFIVLPQAMKKVVPPMANQFISLVKDSSIISLISVQELTYKTVELVASTRAIFEAWITTAAMYFILCFGLSLLFRRFEGKAGRE